MKWQDIAKEALDRSLNPIPNELNEIDWKEQLSSNKDRLKQHLIAFSNHPGGGFLAFGIRNTDGVVLGLTEQDIQDIQAKLTNLGRDSLEPPIRLTHSAEKFEGKLILLTHIKESHQKPVHIRGKSIENSYIRSGGTTRRASRAEIGNLLLHSTTPCYEETHCSALIDGSSVLKLLDYKTIARLMKMKLPTSRAGVLEWLASIKMIVAFEEKGFYVTKLGALCAAKNLEDFGLDRKAVRVIKYKGKNKVETEKEWTGTRGYAGRFEPLIEFVLEKLPSSEVIGRALRAEVTVYPEIAIRELVANALAHQDFSITGAGPMIEIFDDRIEITNPGKLLPSKKVDRLIGATPESRNELLARTFRACYICEERGSGFLKSATAIELYGLPPLRFIEGTNSFKVIMYSPKKYADMSPEERIDAVYQHSVLQFFSDSSLTNKSLRERLKMATRSRPQVSQLINKAIVAKRIKPKDPNNTSQKFAEYVPYWA